MPVQIANLLCVFSNSSDILKMGFGTSFFPADSKKCNFHLDVLHLVPACTYLVVSASATNKEGGNASSSHEICIAQC